MPHTPILYARANGVYYEGMIGTLPNAPGALRHALVRQKLRRYQSLWAEMRLGLSRHGLANEVGDAAIKFAEHLIWKITEHGLADNADDVFIQTMEVMLADSAGACNFQLAKMLLGHLQNPRFVKPDLVERIRNLKLHLPFVLMIQYYRYRLADFGVQLPAVVPIKRPVAVHLLRAPAADSGLVARPPSNSN